ncbi:MAG: hypothetical protein OXL97_04055 [Chloroflexota bacterium]|nr:hypothetical protein [Chloroflexota bacterium]MDE2883606.1 hypothetical protein [Chloroflexota bacterium]
MRALRVGLARWMVATVIPAVFRRVNAAIARVVRSPLHPLLLGTIIVIRCEGRRTGRTYLVPVVCRPSGGGALHALTSVRAVWWRNIESGAPATVYHRGRERQARIDVVRGIDDPSEVERALASRGVVARTLVALPASESVLLRVWLSPDV